MYCVECTLKIRSRIFYFDVEETTGAMTKNTKNAVIFTDMDATLLDHDTYDWAPAAGALAALAERDIPVCLCTSKTVAEVRDWQARLGLHTPFASENGGVVAVPAGYFEPRSPTTNATWQTTMLGTPREALCALAYRLREQRGYRFTGFAEMSLAEIGAATGLDGSAAARAAQRQASEPLLWQDSDQAAAAFTREIEAAGAMTRRGGRFLHVLGRADKADALGWLRVRYEARGVILAVALGDSENDRAMLAAADIGYWVARTDGRYYAPAAGTIRHAPGIGPAGWAAAINALIDRDEL